MKIFKEKIQEILNKAVETVYPSKQELEKVLMSGKRLRIYNGIDPTGKLHLGHLVVLKKLRQFQDLGHEIIILIGGFTATIGDPTGKNSVRKPLTEKQILENAKDYKLQIGKVLNLKKTNVKFLNNKKWLGKLKADEILKIASYFTVARLLERDMFQKRIQEGREIFLHEFLYPIFQAYDSVAMDVDLEIGGSDQIFNMLAGRTLMGKMKQKEKFVLATKLLTDPEGKKMGKSESNLIPLNEKPDQIFGKIMSWPDELIKIGFELLTDFSKKEINEVLIKTTPRNAKARLAKEIVSTCYNKEIAKKAEEEFIRVFKEKKLPTKIPEVKIENSFINILDLLVKTNLASSKSNAKRLVLQKGVKIDGEIQLDWKKNIQIKKGTTIQVGKRKAVKIN